MPETRHPQPHIKTTMSVSFPVMEFIHVVPVVAMGILAINDHYLKSAGLFPGWFTGKLSDFAGLLFFPMLLTSAYNFSAWLISLILQATSLGPKLNYQPQSIKTLVACIITGILFSSLQLSPHAVSVYKFVLSLIGFSPVVTMDPTDLIALSMLPVAHILSRKIRRAETLF